MSTAPTQQPTPERAPVRALTGGQIAVLIIAAALMTAVGIAGAIGTFANAFAELHRSQTALGVVAAGEGATLVAALVMVGVTMLGQPAPRLVRAALWILPAAAAVMGLAIAPTPREAVIYALTPLAMTASAEGISFLARRIVAYTSDTDVEAQRRNAEIMRQIAFHAAQAERHPDENIRAKSRLEAWKLMQRVGTGDAQLGSGLVTVQRDRLTQGADSALQAMLTGTPEPATALPMSRALEPGETTLEPTPEPVDETAPNALFLTRQTAPATETGTPALTDHRPNLKAADQQLHREPVLSPTETTPTKTIQTTSETATAETDEPEPGANEQEQQIAELARQLRNGKRLTKTSAAQLLKVSPATAGRRLKEARARVNDGTGMYL